MANQQQFPVMATVSLIAIVLIVFLASTNINSSLEGNSILANNNFPPTYVAPCEDTDPANRYDVLGVAKHGHRIEEDYCNGNTLFQFTCVTSTALKPTTGYTCPNGCEQGVCL